MRMGSPQYGQLILDGEPVSRARDIEFESLVWSDDRRLLAGQELVSWQDEPKTRVVVFDADRRLRLATSPAVRGLCAPIRFEGDALVFGHWHHRRGEREMRLPLPSSVDRRERTGQTAEMRRHAYRELGAETPRRDWLAVLLPPGAAVILVTVAAVEAASTHYGWLAFGTALLAGLVVPLAYTLLLAREGRLFLREPRSIGRSRYRIARHGVPIGWVFAGLLLPFALAFGGIVMIVILAALGGAALGFWPGLLANFLRLRREVWTR
jgi:hypothetical protein